MKTLRLALVLAGILMLALGSSTVAASSQDNSATVIDIDTCAPLIGGGTVCITSKGMVHEVGTPSGIVSFVTNYRERIQVIDSAGQIVWDETGNERFHALTKDDVLHEMSSRSRFTVTTVGQTFCVEYHLHGTNGEDQFVRIDFCS
jgi:hypothetical protein